MKKWPWLVVLVLPALVASLFVEISWSAPEPQDEPVEADVVIQGATLYDGSGAPGKVGDLAIKGERIVAVGKFQVKGKPRVIDGTSLVVAPGFIDLHTHSDTQLTRADTRPNLSYLMQGSTTVVTGNCGFGPTDVGKFYATMEKGGIGTNALHQVPHNAVREKVMGNANRSPTAQELQQMEALTDQGMRDGAWGMSTGLIYNPGTYAKTEEIVALAKVVAKHQGLYASHIRNEGTGLLAALEEILTIARLAGIRIHISHIKVSGRRAWGRAGEAITLIRAARARGVPVTADQYPYVASSTSLAATLIPPKYREGSAKDFLGRLDDPDLGPKLRKDVADRLAAQQNGKDLRIAAYAKNPAFQGKDLLTVAQEQKKTPVDMALEIQRNGGAQIVNFNMQEEEVRLFMKEPWVATASDGSSQVPSATVPHPRSYGTFPRKIGRYAIEDKIVPLEQAIRSASGLPADILKLPERGYLKKGYYADVVVFDPKTYRDRATFDQPHQYASGVRYVFVNGRAAVDDGRFTGTLAGRVLRYESPLVKK
jgi:N-acyl-D-aspartate/D-glutamate deacylase